MGFQILDGDELEDDLEEEGIDLGPDDRDRDLMDGTWAQKYYSGKMKSRNWNAITAGVALVVVASLIIPMLMVLFN
jgi:hypothetical protein